MGTPRRPRLKKQQGDEQTLRTQRATLKWIRGRLRKKGVNEGSVRALATAYDVSGAGAGMIDEVERAIRDRPQLLVTAIEQSEKTHALLHQIFGGVGQCIDLREMWSEEEERAFSSSGRRKMRSGATSKRIEPVGNEACDLRKKRGCGTIYPHVRQHAEFCRFLREELEAARALAKERSELRAEIESFSILESKGAIANFLSEEIGLSPGHIALFTLVHGDAQAELPVKKSRIASKSHAISEALSQWRRRQTKATGRKNS